MIITDYHSHVLPGIDDGSKNSEQSVKMLEMLAEQNVGTVVATPHFYPTETDIEEFLEKRAAAYERLKPHLREDLPTVKLGAEVYYYNGISRSKVISQLKFQDSDIFLLEMPMAKWDGYIIDELVDMACSANMRIVLAHIDRYMPKQKHGTLEKLLEAGVYMQINADAFLSSNKKTALKYLSGEMIHIIGSDCHNVTSRAPRLTEAIDVIEKKFGKMFTENFIGYNNKFFNR